MGYSAIDPDGVIAMSAATLAASLSVGTVGEEIRKQTDKVHHLVPGAPDAEGRARTEAEMLSEIAGFARSRAVKYVDDVKPLKDLLEAGYWLPDFTNLGWDGEQTALENVDRMARSDEAGAFVLGTAGALLERYRRWQVAVPAIDTPYGRQVAQRLDDLINLPPDDIVNGRPVIRRASGLLVPQGGTADPRVQQMRRLGDGPGVYRPGRGFTTDPGLGRPPAWARTGGRVLGVAGTALTLYDVGASQWEHDQKYHPEWSTAQRVASTGYSVATEGGGAVVGGIYGAQIGATVGSFVPIPVVGTVGGAIIGGAIGAFVGSKAGKAVGTALREGGEAIADGAKKVWNSLFG